MKIGSFNIRGLGVGIKKKKICALTQAESLDFLAIQETKLEKIDTSLCESLWGDGECGWNYQSATGKEGVC